MTTLFLRKILGITTVFAMFLGFFPPSANAAWLGAPTHLSLEGGIYTNDTTPTATWTRPSGATWYQILVDNGEWIDIANESSYTMWSLPNGWHTFYVRARDAANTVSVSTSVTFEVDTVGPTVPAISPSTAVERQATTFRVSPSGESATTFCDLYVNGSSVGSMTKNGTTFSTSYIFNNDGSYTMYARCADGDGNYTTGTSRTVSVSAANDAPSVHDTFYVQQVTPSSAIEDEAVTFAISPYGTLDAVACTLYVSGSSVGAMNETSANTFTKSYTFANDGDYTVYASCKDEYGMWTRGMSRTVTVSQQNTSSNTLNVPTVSPSTAVEDVSTEFTVRPTSDFNVTNCWLYVDGEQVATMSERSTNRFVANYTFRNDGDYTVYAYCKDNSPAYRIGDHRTIHVSNQTHTSTNASRGSLIKIPCGVYANTTETCKAVYYYGDDGKRHVFPNESVFFTWYTDFDDVVNVSQDFMSSLTIGKNVTYRPGSVLVTFASSSKVYAISAKHTLHHYTTTSLLTSDYGNNWTSVLVTVPDALYGNYSIGSVIDSTSDYDRNTAYSSVHDIDDVL